jgi:membrane-associated phospholipid phosphatase
MMDALLPLALFLNAFEDPFLFALLVSGLALIISIRSQPSSLAFFLTLALTFAAVHIAKSLFAIARPEDALVAARGLRFPSMHAAIAAAITTSIWWYAYTDFFRRWPMLQIAATLCAIAVIALVAITRLVLGVHYLIDVVVGVFIGCGIALGFHIATRKLER